MSDRKLVAKRAISNLKVDPPSIVPITTQIEKLVPDKVKKTKVSFWDPVWIIGKLEIKDFKSPFGDVSFQLKATKVEPYTEK